MKKSVMLLAMLAVILPLAGGDGKVTFGSCPVLPEDNIWNVPIDALPLAARSSAYVSAIGAGAVVHADFGSGTWNGGPIGIPFVSVPGSQLPVAIHYTAYGDESDPGPFPIPAAAPVEGGSASSGDRHVLVMDRDHCVLYELYRAFPQADGSWNAESGARYDLGSNALRPAGWTSADAAGLPIFPGLVRYEEVAAGEIAHAIRFTAPQTQRAYVWPARHYASSSSDPALPPMGQRFRLKSGIDISGFSGPVQVILRAMKKYGIILADNGSAWYISGVPDERWDNDMLHELDAISGSNFEAVDCSALMIDPDSGQAGTPAPLQLTSPNGGETWKRLALRAITWRATLAGQVNLFLYQNGVKLGAIAKGVGVFAGTYTWTVGVYSRGTAASGTGYSVRIVSQADPGIFDDNDAAFTIGADAGITVSAPNGGEIWPRLSEQAITWKTSLAGRVKIFLYRNGKQLGVIATGISASTHAFTWTVGRHSNGTAPLGSGYAVRVQSMLNPVKSDMSDAMFAIQ